MTSTRHGIIGTGYGTWLRVARTADAPAYYYTMSVPPPLTTQDFEGGAAGWPIKVQTLLEAVLVLAGEHELDTVLRRIVAGAAAIAEAKYAALGIYNEAGAIESFIHHGMDDDTSARIGSLPDGHGLLGEVIVASGPIRLADLGDGLDIIVFTGGIGEHQPTVRSAATDGLRFLGLAIDPAATASRPPISTFPPTTALPAPSSLPHGRTSRSPGKFARPSSKGLRAQPHDPKLASRSVLPRNRNQWRLPMRRLGSKCPNEDTLKRGGHAMHWNWNDSWSGWNWALMMIGMVAFWGLVAWAIVALVRSPNRSQRVANKSAEEILAGRLAAGEIEGDEYQHRLDVLRSGKVPTGK